MSNHIAVSVIIPTACASVRVSALRRAIASVLSQQGVHLDVIVVVNGPAYDRDMVGELRANPALRVEYLEAPSLPAALRHGRALIAAPYFSFLDDDDEYLPGALCTRVQVLLDELDVDLVATTGLLSGPDGDRPHIRSARGVEDDPLATLLQANWLVSCGTLLRADTVSSDFFDGCTRYFEWTMIALRLLLAGRRVRFLDIPTYRIHETEGSLSRSDAYHEAEPAFLASLLEFGVAPQYRRDIRRKYFGSLHGLAERSAKAGDMAAAWRYHLRSVAGRSGIKHVAYTRCLVAPTLRAGARALTGRSGVREQGVVG